VARWPHVLAHRAHKIYWSGQGWLVCSLDARSLRPPGHPPSKLDSTDAGKGARDASLSSAARCLRAPFTRLPQIRRLGVRAFKNFDPRKVARFGKAEVRRLLRDAGIISNRLKIEGAITNARRFLEVQKEFGSFDRYIRGFTGNRTLRDPNGVTSKTLKATSPESEALSKNLKQRGFKFVGLTVCYAHMQATGMVDDHEEGCFKYRTR